MPRWRFWQRPDPLLSGSQPNIVFRVGYKPLWTPPPPQYAGASRFDDPLGQYRVVYAASSQLGCVVEILDHFRVNPALVAALASSEEPEDHIPPGVVPPGFFCRVTGSASLSDYFADRCHSEWLARLRRLPEHHALDTSDLQGRDRTLTQAVGHFVHEDPAAFDGIRYPSRLGHDFENLAIFDRAPITIEVDETPIRPDDLHLLQALTLLHLTLPE